MQPPLCSQSCLLLSLRSPPHLQCLLQVDWGKLGVELVLEASGKFLTRDKLQPFFDAGVKKVVVSGELNCSNMRACTRARR